MNVGRENGRNVTVRGTMDGLPPMVPTSFWGKEGGSIVTRARAITLGTIIVIVAGLIAAAMNKRRKSSWLDPQMSKNLLRMLPFR